jgi:hypothetical protein
MYIVDACDPGDFVFAVRANWKDGIHKMPPLETADFSKSEPIYCDFSKSEPIKSDFTNAVCVRVDFRRPTM